MKSVSLDQCICGIGVGTNVCITHIWPNTIMSNTARFNGSTDDS